MEHSGDAAVEIVSLGDMHVVGIPVTSVFKEHNPARIEEVKKRFMDRRREIKHVADDAVYYSPHFASDVAFTYFFCMEVTELSDVPDGMLAFTIPARRYATTRSDTDPYAILHTYLSENGMNNDLAALALEKYPLDNPKWPEHAVVYIPIK